MSPDFLYIGPDKSGSSWLFKVLQSHPECYVPDCKDVYYFDKYYQRGGDWYLGFFDDAPSDTKVAGEISHGYLFDEEAPQRIYRDFPNIKIMTTLRHPVERAISHYFYLRSGGLVKGTIRDAVQQRPGILASSHYAESVKRYLDVFPKEQINISFFESLKEDPRQHAFNVFEFLGLAELDCIDFGAKVREARKPKNVMVARALKLAAIRARDLGLTTLVGKIKNSNMVNVLYNPLDKADKERVSYDEKQWLLTVFRDDVCELEDVLGQELPAWKVV